MITDGVGPVKVSFRKKREFPEQKMGRDLMVFDPESDQVHIFNSTSALIWECLGDGLDSEGIRERISDTYDLETVKDLPEVIHRALVKFQEKGLVEEVLPSPRNEGV